MRGWSPLRTGRLIPFTGSPAYAGMVRNGDSKAGLCRRFPRVCGDGPLAQVDEIDALAVPPRMRGWSLMCCLFFRVTQGSPAYAGMVHTWGLQLRAKGRFPRVCGDGPHIEAGMSKVHMVPPRMRGWSPCPYPDSGQRKGSPAYAGMVLIFVRSSTPASWFPRVCGDGPDEHCQRCIPTWVPPRMRGWSPSPAK